MSASTSRMACSRLSSVRSRRATTTRSPSGAARARPPAARPRRRRRRAPSRPDPGPRRRRGARPPPVRPGPRSPPDRHPPAMPRPSPARRSASAFASTTTVPSRASAGQGANSVTSPHRHRGATHPRSGRLILRPVPGCRSLPGTRRERRVRPIPDRTMRAGADREDQMGMSSQLRATSAGTHDGPATPSRRGRDRRPDRLRARRRVCLEHAPTGAAPTTTAGSGGDAVVLADLELASALQPFDACEDLLGYVKEQALERVTAYGLGSDDMRFVAAGGDWSWRTRLRPRPASAPDAPPSRRPASRPPPSTRPRRRRRGRHRLLRDQRPGGGRRRAGHHQERRPPHPRGRRRHASSTSTSPATRRW